MSKSEAIQQYKELEKKVKTCEADLIQMQEDLSSAERARRAAEAERDDLQEEINNHAGKGSLMSDEKRRLDARIGKKKYFSYSGGTWPWRNE